MFAPQSMMKGSRRGSFTRYSLPMKTSLKRVVQFQPVLRVDGEVAEFDGERLVAVRLGVATELKPRVVDGAGAGLGAGQLQDAAAVADEFGRWRGGRAWLKSQSAADASPAPTARRARLRASAGRRDKGFLRRELGDFPLPHVAADEEGVRARGVATGEEVALLGRELGERGQRRAVIPAAFVMGVTLERRLVGHRHAARRAEAGVELDDEQARRDHRDRVPNPVIHAINVNGEHVQLALETVLGEEVVDVLLSDEVGANLDVLRRDGVAAVVEGPSAVGERITAVHEQPAPAEMQRKVRGVALRAVLDAELDESLVRRADLGKEVEQQPVLAELRVNLALVRGEELALVRRG